MEVDQYGKIKRKTHTPTQAIIWVILLSDVSKSKQATPIIYVEK